MLSAAVIAGAGLFFSGLAVADNCTGYIISVISSSTTKDVGNGMTLTSLRLESVSISDNSIYHLTTGETSASILSTPDGKVRLSGYSVYSDKDGDTYAYEFSRAPTARDVFKVRGVFKVIGGTGKYAGNTDSGWYETARRDGNVIVSNWEGTCR
jgi:hypothetical protein